MTTRKRPVVYSVWVVQCPDDACCSDVMVRLERDDDATLVECPLCGERFDLRIPRREAGS